MKYAGLDVHDESIAIRIIDATGLPLHEAVVPTNRARIRAALRAVRGPLAVAFEEGPLAPWLCETLRGRVAELTVCATRRMDLHGNGSRTDRSDAARLAEGLRVGAVRPVFHGSVDAEALRVLARHYAAVTRDVQRVKSRLRAVFRARAIATGGSGFFLKRRRSVFLRKLAKRPADHLRARALFEQLDLLSHLKDNARAALVARAAAEPAFAILTTCPCVGPVRAALFIAIVVTPDRFRNRRRFWRYGGVAVRQRATGEHALINGSLKRLTKKTRAWGLDRQCNHALKSLLRQTACGVIASGTILRGYYDRALERGLAPAVARTVLARRIGAILLSLWRNMCRFDPNRLTAPSLLPPEHHAASSTPVSEARH